MKKKIAKQFGGCIKALCGMLDALECDVGVENYPRVMYAAGRETELKTEPTIGGRIPARDGPSTEPRRATCDGVGESLVGAWTMKRKESRGRTHTCAGKP